MFLKSSDDHVQIVSGVDEKNVQPGDEVCLTLTSESSFSNLQVGSRGAELLESWQASLSPFQASRLFSSTDLQKLSAERRASLDIILQHNPLYLVFHRFEGVFPRIGADVYCQLAPCPPNYDVLRVAVISSKTMDLYWRNGYIFKEADLVQCSIDQWSLLTRAGLALENGCLHSPYYDQIHRKARNNLLEIIASHQFCDNALLDSERGQVSLQDMHHGLGQHPLMDQLFTHLSRSNCHVSIVEIKGIDPNMYGQMDTMLKLTFGTLTNLIDFADTWLMQEIEDYLQLCSMRTLVLLNVQCISAFHTHLLLNQIRASSGVRQRLILIYNGDVESTSSTMLRVLGESIDASLCDTFCLRSTEAWCWEAPRQFFQFPSAWEGVCHTAVANLDNMIAAYFALLDNDVRSIFLCSAFDELNTLASHDLTPTPMELRRNTVMSFRYDYCQALCYYQGPEDERHSIVDKACVQTHQLQRCIQENDALECCNVRLLDGTSTRVSCVFFYTERAIDAAMMHKLVSLASACLVIITRESNLLYLYQ